MGGSCIATRECDRDGASETRTRDLLGAIQALSQLSYSPVRRQSRAVGHSLAGKPGELDHRRVACPLGASLAAVVRPLRAANVVGARYDYRMGLLDDAIREHLDLKRRRGADPTEIERAERDALGPVRRDYDDEPPPAFDEVHDDLPAAEPGAPVAISDPYDDPFADDGYEDDPFADADDAPPADRYENEPPVAEVPPVPPPRTVPRAAEPPAGESPRPVPVRAPDRVQPPSPSSRPGVGDETVEWDVERALQEEESGERPEDPLEETPEFLQDAPEHDRLWFEQRPPRDFDFNG